MIHRASPIHKKPNLLPNNHPTYLRRLARELSGRPSGFYHDGHRWSHATFSKGKLRIWRTAAFTSRGGRTRVSMDFADVSQTDGPFFDDGNGNSIMASRRP